MVLVSVHLYLGRVAIFAYLLNYRYIQYTCNNVGSKKYFRFIFKITIRSEGHFATHNLQFNGFNFFVYDMCKKSIYLRTTDTDSHQFLATAAI